MKLLLSILLLLNSSLLLGQYRSEKEQALNGIDSIVFIMNYSHSIHIENTQEVKMHIETMADGEYKNNVLLRIEQKNKTLYVTEVLQPFLSIEDDKLSAHKIFSLKTRIRLPSHLYVTTKSTTATLATEGSFKHLFTELNSGSCILTSFVGDAIINTYRGDITLYTKNATISSRSVTGNISSEPIFGQHQIRLKSISGNINIHKIK
ncbi:hypothetical protein ACFSTE_00750 [Aquimarina hainanensis]|uniref:Adhesin domain-containing protein n=1 Tax=Aquimarina hainanensis TaxID=1578017 RepID=A0ABW5N1G5_9FLAO